MRFNSGTINHSIVIIKVEKDVITYIDFNGPKGLVVDQTSIPREKLEKYISKKLNLAENDGGYGYISRYTKTT